MRQTVEQSGGELMTVEELAAYLRVSSRAVYAMVHREQVPGVVRLGRRLRFARDAIQAWVARASAHG